MQLELLTRMTICLGLEGVVGAGLRDGKDVA
jgi:hypothetical protein